MCSAKNSQPCSTTPSTKTIMLSAYCAAQLPAGCRKAAVLLQHSRNTKALLLNSVSSSQLLVRWLPRYLNQ